MPVLGPRPIYQAWEACGIAPGPLTFHLFPPVLQDEPLPLISLASPVHLPTECKCKAVGLRNNSEAMEQGHGYKSLPVAPWLIQAVCHTRARWPLWHNREKYRPGSEPGFGAFQVPVPHTLSRLSVSEDFPLCQYRFCSSATGKVGEGGGSLIEIISVK